MFKGTCGLVFWPTHPLPRPLPWATQPSSCPCSCVVACQTRASVPEHLVPCFQGFGSSKSTEVQLPRRLNPGAWRQPGPQRPDAGPLDPTKSLTSLPNLAHTTSAQLLAFRLARS